MDLTGTIAAGSQDPTGDAVAITLDGVTQDAVVNSDGSFSTTFTTTSLRKSDALRRYLHLRRPGPFLAADGSSHVTVTPASLTITADSKSMTYGVAVPPLTASSHSGFVNADTPTSLATPVVLSTTATSHSPVGAYPITAAGASSPDYTISYVVGTLTVTPALLTITANSQTIPYAGSRAAVDRHVFRASSTATRRPA